MKKIIFVNPSMGLGGAERVISIWANYFSKNRNIEIAIEKGNESFYRLASNVKLINLDFKISLKILPVYRLIKMYNFLKRNSNSIIIFNKYRYVMSLFILRKLHMFKNIKLVYFSHGGISDFEKFYPKRRSKIIFQTFDEIICLYKGEAVKLDYINKDKISIIPNPVSFTTSKKANYKNKEILYVGRLSTFHKGLDYLIEIWEKISKEHQDWTLKIIGDGEDKELLKNLIKLKKLKNIFIINGVKNIEEYYLNGSILVLTSRYEGMPMVVMEAMECGLPIVSFRIDGIENLIENNKNGYIVEKYNLQIFGEKLRSLMTNIESREKMGKMGKIKAREFKIENRIKFWEKIIKE